jgi:hypothetical protein
VNMLLLPLSSRAWTASYHTKSFRNIAVINLQVSFHYRSAKKNITHHEKVPFFIAFSKLVESGRKN